MNIAYDDDFKKHLIHSPECVACVCGCVCVCLWLYLRVSVVVFACAKSRTSHRMFDDYIR